MSAVALVPTYIKVAQLSLETEMQPIGLTNCIIHVN